MKRSVHTPGWLAVGALFLLSLPFGRSALTAQASNDQESGEYPKGSIVPKIVCRKDPQQSYALYLPSTFSKDRKWPVVYVFDPVARGQVATEVIQSAAEKFGYIIAASNNSRNGPMGGSSQAAKAMWEDVQQRFPIDENRRYFAGMSGGARVATSFAIACNCVAGVISNAAGFPTSTSEPPNPKFAYFGAVGDADFNYGEFVQLRTRLDKVAARYRIRVFEGPHGWAPSEVWIEALDWMDLQAMATGAMPRDQKRIQASMAEALTRTSAYETKNDILNAAREYQSVVRDFIGLADVTTAKSRLADLEKNKSVKSAEKQETAEIEQQDRLQAVPLQQMQTISEGGMGLEDIRALHNNMADLKRQAAGSDRTSLITRRALGGLIVQAYESGQRSMEQKNYRDALLYFELAVFGARDPSWAHYQRARAYAMISDRKNMLAELRLCLAGQFHDVSALDAEEFQAYRNQPEFLTIAAEWKQKAGP